MPPVAEVSISRILANSSRLNEITLSIIKNLPSIKEWQPLLPARLSTLKDDNRTTSPGCIMPRAEPVSLTESLGVIGEVI